MTILEYYLHDEPDVLRIEIVGDQSGAGVGSIEHAWRTATSVLAGRHIVVGLTAVAEADADGRGILLTWHRCGARIIARSMDSRTLAESILDLPVPMPPAKSGWRQRFSDFLRRWAAAATNMANANKRFGSLAAPRTRNEEFKALFKGDGDGRGWQQPCFLKSTYGGKRYADKPELQMITDSRNGDIRVQQPTDRSTRSANEKGIRLYEE